MRKLLSLFRRPQPPEIAAAPNSFPAKQETSGNFSRQVGLEDLMASGWFNGEKAELCDGFSIGTEDVVLDFGCGDGNYLKYCCSYLPKKAIGIDVNEAALNRARELLSACDGVDIELHLSTTPRQPYEDGIATKLICSEVLEHVESPREVLAELVRLGRENAQYLITVPGELAERGQSFVAPDVYFERPNHIRVFKETEIEQLLVEAGLTIESKSFIGYYWSVWWSIYWGTGADWDQPSHPSLLQWASAWRDFIQTPGGLQAKQQLDKFMPKSLVFVARKSANQTSEAVRSLIDNPREAPNEAHDDAWRHLKALRQVHHVRALEIMPSANSPLAFVVDDESVPLWLPTDDVIGHHALRDEGWEPRSADFFAAQAKHIDGGICLVDVGANIGLFSRQCASQIPNITHAFLYEPQTFNFELLERNIGRWPTGLHLVNAAIADKSHTMDFYEDPNNCGNYSLNPHAMPRDFRTTTVQAIAGREEAEKWLTLGRPIFYKSDTQGFDEIIATNFPLAFWGNVHCAVFELWRIKKPGLVLDHFTKILDSFPFRSFASEPGRQLELDEILAFLRHDDGLFNDLFCSRSRHH